MKYILSIATMLICLHSVAQGDRIEYSSVVSSPDSASADELYSRSKAWLLETFADAQSVIEIDDASAALIGGTGAMQLEVKYKRRVIYQDATYRLKIEHKDGRCRISASNVTFLVRNNMAVAAGVGDPIVRVPAENWFIHNPDGKGVKEMKAATDVYFRELFDSFERFHAEHPANSDW